jgi:predicted nucleic acid-binding Zn ribbon protein
LSSWKGSTEFFCLGDRGSTATMVCKACGTEFEADVEEHLDPTMWLLLAREGSNWSEMLLRCPSCPNHEGHPPTGHCELCGRDIEPDAKTSNQEIALHLRHERREVLRARRSRD